MTEVVVTIFNWNIGYFFIYWKDLPNKEGLRFPNNFILISYWLVYSKIFLSKNVKYFDWQQPMYHWSLTVVIKGKRDYMTTPGSYLKLVVKPLLDPSHQAAPLLHPHSVLHYFILWVTKLEIVNSFNTCLKRTAA